LHNTGSQVIERVYSAHISSHGDEAARHTLLDTTQPVRDVVSLPARR
jgi:hypothetical protein